MKRKLRVLDLFSGIGGFSLGLERTGGFETKAFCEIDQFCRNKIIKHWPGAIIYRDIRELTAAWLEAEGIKIDLICGGFPCQDVSEAWSGDGLDGARSGLWAEFARLIGEIKPRWIIVENVSNLLVRGMGRVLRDLASLGYDAEWHCIPASRIGAPHVRDRVWIIAHRSEIGWKAASLNFNAVNEICNRPQWAPAQSGKRWRDLVSFLESHDASRFWEAAHSAPSGVDDGLPDGLDALAIGALGNSVIPQIPEIIGHAILSAEAA